MAKKAPRVVVVSRPTELDELLARHCTREQARFFLETREQSIDGPEERHALFHRALTKVLSAVPAHWQCTRVDRSDLDRFLFRPDDVVVALGRDGLVANTAKYLDGQPVIGLNPDPSRNVGILVPHSPEDAGDLLALVHQGRATTEDRTMVQVTLDDGQRLLALNEVFLGHQTHQSARYRINSGGMEELHSSSGVIVSTGTGSTGWAKSVNRNRLPQLRLPSPTDPQLAFFVREAWASVATGTAVSEGLIEAGEELVLTSRMNEGGVIFGDGIEADRIEWGWGQQVRISLAPIRLHLVSAGTRLAPPAGLTRLAAVTG